MLEIGVVVFVQMAMLVAVVILREPKLLIPCVVLGLPFEYVSTQAVGSLGESGAGGAIRTLLNPGKAAMLATIVMAVIKVRHNPLRLIPNSSLVIPLCMLLAVVLLGVAWSDSTTPSNSVLIMPMYVAFVFAVPLFIEDRRDLERIVAAFFIAAIFCSLVAIAQRLLGVFNWRSILIQSDAYSYRSNSFFADPNNFARFLAITIALAAGVILTSGPRRLTIYLAAPVIAIGGLAIILTASRSGWLGMLLAAFLVVMMAPIRRYTKLRLTTLAFGGLFAMLTLVFMQGGTDAERVKSLASGVELLGQRAFLIEGGWEMFKDNPLAGIGSGNYQRTLVTSYLWTLPWWAETTLSHTSLISVLAELGLVGVAALLFTSFRIGATAARTYFANTGRDHRLCVAWVIAALVEIVFQSQSEGRLFEEPFMYLLFGILIALELGAGTRLPERRALEQPVSVPAREPGAVAVRRGGEALPLPSGATGSG